MRICIYGAGAIGSNFAVRLANAGHDVACVMRGAHLEATKANGLTLKSGDATFRAKVNASDNPEKLGPQDVVISTLKANALASLADGVPPLLARDTAVVFAQNGIPWWYDIGLPAEHPSAPAIDFLDPGGKLRASVDRERIVGGVIFSSNELVEPGVVVHESPDRNVLFIGECDDRQSERIAQLRGVLDQAGIRSPSTQKIRETIWTKLVGIMTLSVLCALTEKSIRDTVTDPAIEALVPRLIAEGEAVAQSCYAGVAWRSRDRSPVAHKPSFLQDYERERPMEVDALIRAPLAFARRAGLATPMLDLMAGLVISKVRERGLY